MCKILNCIYNGRFHTALNVRDPEGIIDLELRNKLQLLGSENKLLCPECENPVILKAGPIKTPHFSHKTQPGTQHCIYREQENEGEIHRRGKEILYHYFKKRYPKAELIQPEHLLPNKRRADLYIKFDSVYALVIEFQKSNLQLQEWRDRHYDYARLNIKDIWLLFGKFQALSKIKREYKLNSLDLTILTETKDQQLLYLDVNGRNIIIMRPMRYMGAEGRVLKDSLFSAEYSIDEILIKPNGDIECDFQKKFEKAYKKFQNECSSSVFYEDFYKSKSAAPQPFPVIDYVIPNKTYQKSYSKSNYNPQSEDKIRNYIQKAVGGSQISLGIIKRILIEGGTREIHLIVQLFKESYEHGHIAAKRVYLKLAEDINFLPFIYFEETEQEANKIHLHDNNPAQITEDCILCYYYGKPGYIDLCARKKPGRECLSFSPRAKTGQPEI